MDIRSLSFAIAAMAAPASALLAQTDTVSLARAVAIARGASPRITAATSAVAAATARIGPAGALPDPQLTLGLMNRSLSGMSDPLTMNQVTLMQMIPVNGALGQRRQAARFDSSRSDAERDAVQLLVERDVRRSYWELYHADQALAVMDRTLAVLRELAATAGAMYAVGSVPQSDVVRAQVAITRMEQEIAAMRLDRVRAAAELNAAMGRPAEAGIVLPPQDPHQADHAALRPLDTPPPPPLDSLLAFADSMSPMLRAARAMVASSQANQSSVRRMLYPDLGVGVSFGHRPDTGDNMASLELGISLPLFARSRQLRMRDEAAAMVAQAEAEENQARLELRAQLLAAREAAETARLQVARIAGTLVPQAEASYQATLAAYRVGKNDFLSVLDAQTALLNYQHDLHSYEAAYGAAGAEVDRLIGRPFAAADHPETP